mmetsp:Transcript_5302/g.18807  ORF Transcript_5302/g.18807 Transcript_5302/m.18807 type:complete len:200 (-) Transcript_5302:1369-1968(-)
MGCPRLVYRCTAFQSNSSDVGCIESRSFSKSEVMRNRLSFVHTPGAARISQRMAFSAVCSWRWFARDDPGGLMHTLFREHFTSFGSTSLANHPRAATPTNVVAQCSRDSGAAAQPSAATADLQTEIERLHPDDWSSLRPSPGTHGWSAFQRPKWTRRKMHSANIRTLLSWHRCAPTACAARRWRRARARRCRGAAERRE